MPGKKDVSRRKFIKAVVVGGIGGAVLSSGIAAIPGSVAAKTRTGKLKVLFPKQRRTPLPGGYMGKILRVNLTTGKISAGSG